MTAPDRYARVAELQEQLGQAKQVGDVDAEIDALLEIGALWLEGEDPGGAHMHFKLAERVMRGAKRELRLHEALGGQGRARRRRGDTTGAIECFDAAEAVAHNPLAEAEWALARASALRAAGEGAAAHSAVRGAENLIRQHREYPGALSALAELEGQLGLGAMAEGDQEAAEDHYLAAVDAARAAKDDGALAVWATNLGNACTRERRYTAAVAAYTEAIDAGRRADSPRTVRNAALRMADCLERAHRFQEASERLLELAGAYEDGALRERAQPLLDRVAVRPGLQAPPGGPTALDMHLSQAMQAATEHGHLGAALEAAEVVCDIKTALVIAGGRQWKRMIGGDLLSEPGLDLRALTDAVRILVEGDRVGDAFEVLQRSKGPGACASVVRRYAQTGAPCPEGDRYVAALAGLRDCVEPLAGPVRPDFAVAVHALRAAGERVREAGGELRERDPVLHARMGGVVRPAELIDSLPTADPVAIVDFVVGADATAGVVVLRDGAVVRPIPLVIESFTAEHAGELLRIYAGAGVAKAFGGEQADALAAISSMLHDRLLCRLAQALSGMGITQLILVPDVLTRFLPLHLARICGREIQVPVDAAGAEYLCEVMPVELAPCAQAIAASQVHRRPRTIGRIAAFGDPGGDLPAARATLESFRERLAEPEVCDLRTGQDATTEAVSRALAEADLLVFGTHGELALDSPEESHLVLADGVWALRDVVDAPELPRNPLLVLAACEVGAATLGPDERDAYGISGALLAAGASAVLANLWPVEDLTAGYLTERFLHYLSHPGYRPAAALFRAVRDMRRLGRDEAFELCRRHVEALEAAGAAARELVAAENMLELIEDGEAEHPFSEPLLWGATVIIGSGWALPVGASVTRDPLAGIDAYLEQQTADRLVRDGEYADALERVRKLAAHSDGAPRARALTTQALATLLSAEPTTRVRARRRVRGLLAAAERTALAEDDEGLLERIAHVRRLMEDGDVVTAQH